MVNKRVPVGFPFRSSEGRSVMPRNVGDCLPSSVKVWLPHKRLPTKAVVGTGTTQKRFWTEEILHHAGYFFS